MNERNEQFLFLGNFQFVFELIFSNYSSSSDKSNWFIQIQLLILKHLELVGHSRLKGKEYFSRLSTTLKF